MILLDGKNWPSTAIRVIEGIEAYLVQHQHTDSQDISGTVNFG